MPTTDISVKAWMTKALDLLKASLEPPKHELNELDWQASLSPDKKRLAEHLSALSNQPGGGWLVFGVDATGTPVGVNEKTVETTVNQLALNLVNVDREQAAVSFSMDLVAEDDGGGTVILVSLALVAFVAFTLSANARH